MYDYISATLVDPKKEGIEYLLIKLSVKGNANLYFGHIVSGNVTFREKT
jgi:hypothetical protein